MYTLLKSDNNWQSYKQLCVASCC